VDGDEGVGEEGVHVQVRGPGVLGQRHRVQAQLMRLMRRDGGREGGRRGVCRPDSDRTSNTHCQ